MLSPLGGGVEGARSLSIRTARRYGVHCGLGGAGARALRAGQRLTKSHAPHRDRKIVGRTPHTTLYEASTPTPRCAVGWAGWVWARMIHPDPDAAHARMRGPTPHEISEPPPFPLTPFACSPGAAPHPLALLLYALVSTQLLPLQVSARHRHGVVPRVHRRRRHRRASRKSRPRPALPPCTTPTCPAPLGGRGRSTFIPRSVPSGHAVEIPCLDRGLTAPHRPHRPLSHSPHTAAD